MSADVMTDPAVAEARADYYRAADEMTASLLRLQAAARAFREAHPAPAGKVWTEVGGVMHLIDVTPECTDCDPDGYVCGALAVAWDADGDGYCEDHKEHAS